MSLSLTNYNIYRKVHLPTHPLEKKNNGKKKEREKENLHAYDKLSHRNTSVSTSQGSLGVIVYKKHLWIQV